MNRQLTVTYLVLVLLGVLNMIRGIIMENLCLTVVFAILAIVGILALRAEHIKSNK